MGGAHRERKELEDERLDHISQTDKSLEVKK